MLGKTGPCWPAKKLVNASVKFRLRFGVEASEKEKAGTKFKLFLGVEPKWLCRPHHRPLSSRAAITFSSYFRLYILLQRLLDTHVFKFPFCLQEFSFKAKSEDNITSLDLLLKNTIKMCFLKVEFDWINYLIGPLQFKPQDCLNDWMDSLT